MNFYRNRSIFYLNIIEEDDNVHIGTNLDVMYVVQSFLNQITHIKHQFIQARNKPDYFYVNIPSMQFSSKMLESLYQWAELCNSCVWVKLNKNTKDIFNKNSLDFCICSDWNFNFDGKSGRTEIGEVEYKLKYVGEISKSNILTIKQHLRKCLACIGNYFDDVLVTTIPAITEKQNKPSWTLAQFVGKELNADFLTTTLLEDKPQMKSLDVADKVRIWREIYSTDGKIQMSIDQSDLYGKTVIIVDDLYQSGASMWCYAEYLKWLGASNVVGIALVKSLKDSDNKNHG